MSKEITDKDIEDAINDAMVNLLDEASSKIIALSLIYQTVDVDDELRQWSSINIRNGGDHNRMFLALHKHANQILDA